MKRFSPSFAVTATVALVVLLATVASHPLHAQSDPRRVLVPPQAMPGASRSDGSASTARLLKTNYRLTLAAKANDKPLGEISYVTCATTTTVSGPINSDKATTTILATGELTEREDGTLLWDYSLRFNVPVATGLQIEPGQNQPAYANIQYSNHETRGSLILKPGKACELLKVAGAAYTVTITPESETK